MTLSETKGAALTGAGGAEGFISGVLELGLEEDEKAIADPHDGQNLFEAEFDVLHIRQDHEDSVVFGGSGDFATEADKSFGLPKNAANLSRFLEGGTSLEGLTEDSSGLPSI